MNKLVGFVRGAIRRLGLQREESSESFVWDVDIQINWISRVRKYRSDANLDEDFDAIVNENYDINYSRIDPVHWPSTRSFHYTFPYS